MVAISNGGSTLIQLHSSYHKRAVISNDVRTSEGFRITSVESENRQNSVTFRELLMFLQYYKTSKLLSVFYIFFIFYIYLIVNKQQFSHFVDLSIKLNVFILSSILYFPFLTHKSSKSKSFTGIEILSSALLTISNYCATLHKFRQEYLTLT